MANIRMPDGTVIRGVPDGVSKQDFHSHLIKKYGQERFDSMTGSTRKALSPDGGDNSPSSAPPTSNASSYLRNIEETENRDATIEEQNEAVRMRRQEAGEPESPENPNKFNMPYQTAGRKTSGFGSDVNAVRDEEVKKPIPLTGDRLRQKAAKMRSEAAANDPELQLKEEQRRTRETLTAAKLNRDDGSGTLGLGKDDVTPEEQARRQGEIMRRMINTEQRRPEDYRLTQEEYDGVFNDRVQDNVLAAQAASEGGEAGQTKRDEDAGWWRYLGETLKNLPGRVFTGAKAASDMHNRLALQEQQLGELFLERAAAESKELSPEAHKVLDESAAKYGMDRTQYANFVAETVDKAWEDEEATLKEFAQIQEDIAKYKPEGAEDGIGYYGGMFIDNINNIAYIGAGVATMNPITMMALMGTDIYANTYANARLEGRSSHEASMDAFASTVIEAGTEAIPVGKFIALRRAGGKSATRKFLEGLAVEGAQEVLAEGAQIGYDMGVIGKDISLGEAAIRVRDAGIMGMMIGTTVSAPVAVFSDNTMQNLSDDVTDAKKRLGALAMAAQNPDNRIDSAEVKKVREDYIKAVRAKGKYVLEQEKVKAEKKKAKVDKKEAKRKSKLTPVEAKREAAAAAAEKADQTLTEPVTEADMKMADVLDRASKAELGSEDAEAVQEALDAGYMQITAAGTPVVLQAGKRRIEAVRAAEKGVTAVQDEIIEPIPYESEKKRAKSDAVDKEIGQLIRGEEAPVVIKPTPFTSQQRRKENITKRVTSKVSDPAVREKIADEIIKAEEIEEAYNKRNEQAAKEAVSKRDEDYGKALEQQTDVDLEVANNLAILDEKGVSGYTGTRLGDVLRSAMNVLEKQEAKAIKTMKSQWANMSEQGTLFDVSEVMIKGTAMYANAVKVGALKVAKHGLKYSAWTADMIGEFGDSIRPSLARIYHDSKKAVSDIMRLSHEKFAAGPRKGELKYSPKQFAKPGAIQRMRNTLRKLAKEGAEGRFWYEKSGKEILKITGGNKALARKLAGLLAIYSSGTAVSANTTNALKMWGRFYGTGKLVKPKSGTMAGRFSEQDRSAIEWMESNADDAHHTDTFGNKRMAFFTNIMREIDPKNYDTGQGVTVDLWMMRALGYDQDAPTDAQNAFVQAEIMQIAKEMGWENQQAQAAIWVAIKARWEFITKKAKERAVKEGLAEFTPQKKGAPLFDVIGNTREEQIENEKKIIVLFRDMALRVSSAELTKKLEESKADFADNLSKHYATISWEAEPSTKLGSLLNQMSLADKVMMQAEISEILTNPKTGREYLAEWLELLGQDQFQGAGAWNLKIGAAVQNSVIVPIEHKPDSKSKASQAEAAQAMDGYAAILGFLLKQDAVAWHKPFYATTLMRANGVEILTKTLTPAKALKFYEEIFNLTQDMGHAPIVMDGAVRVMNFPEKNEQTGEYELKIQNRAFHALIAQAADNAGISGNHEVFQSDGNMIGNDWDTNKKGEGYVEAINNNQNPRVEEAFKRAKHAFAKRIAEVYEKYASEEANARVSATRLRPGTKLKRVAKGNLRFRHFGKADVGVLNVEKAGTGIKGAESRRGSMKVISAYPNKGFAKEVGLGNNEYVIDVPRSRMYDVNADPMGLKDQAQEVTSFKMVGGKKVPTNTRLDMNKLEQLIKDAGFAGYHTPKASGNLKGQARFFSSIVVDQRPGQLTFDRGPRGSATVYSGQKNIGTVRPTVSDEVLAASPGIQSWSMAVPGTTRTYSISDRPRVTIVENEFDEYEVREKNGEVYYTDDVDDAAGTARSIHGADATIVVVDSEGELITTMVATTKPERIKLKGFGEKVDSQDVARVSEFLDEWFENTQANPLSPDERVVNGTAAVELRPQGGQIWIDSLRSFTKSEGAGSEALKDIITLADQHGITLRLTAKPFDTGGNELDFKTLVQFYSRNGFITNRTEEGYEPSAAMTRPPKNVTGKFHMWKRPTEKQNAGYGMAMQKVRDFTRSFGNRLGLGNFEVVESIEDLPDDVYVDITKLEGHTQVQGVFYEDPILGPTVYIVSNNLFDANMNPSVDMLVDVLMHETIGHFGTRAFLGERGYDQFMDAIRKAFPAEVKKRGRGMAMTPYGRRLAAEEVFAYFVGENLKGVDVGKVATSFLDRAVLALKMFLAKLGVRNLKQQDLYDMMWRVTDYVRTTSEGKLKKRAKQVERMREALAARTNSEYRDELRKTRVARDAKQTELDNAYRNKKPVKKLGDELIDLESRIDLLESGEYVTARFSMKLDQERKADPALDRFMTKIGHGHGNKITMLRDWWHARKMNMRRAFEIEMLDQFAGIKHMERELKILGAESGYMSVRLTAGTDVIIRSAIENAVPTWDADGSVKMDDEVNGLLEVLAPVSHDHEMLKAFEAFLVARRARRLKKEDREKLFSREEIGAALKFIRKNKVHKLFSQTAKDLAQYKSKVLDFAQEAGLIDPVSRKLWENNDHVPFYRVLADVNKKGPFASSRIGAVGKVVHRLKGGSDPLHHPLESIVKNLSMLIEASVKNRATADVVNNFMGTGVVTKAPQAVLSEALIPMSQIKDMLFENGVSLDAVGQDLLDGVQKLTSLQAPVGDNVISVQENGKKQYYYVHDTGVMRGLDAVSPNQWIWLMKVLRWPKRLITRSITLMPDFILKNWFRDIFHTYMLNRNGTVIPILDSGRGWAKAIAHDDTFKDIISGGGVFDSGFVNASDPEKTNIAIRRALLGKGRHGILDTPKKLKDFYMRIANGAENAHRIIVFEKALKAGKSRKEALFEARDLMDFSVRGANPVVRFLTETVPFWGARVQGISRTTKGFNENPALTLMRATPIVLASIALYAINRDDDRYDGLSEYEKRMYYHFYDVFETGDHYQLPKPFEVGAIFSSIPEVMTELMMSEEPDRGKAAAASVYWVVSEMLSLWPDVQAINPIYELATNENRFTQVPILSEWEKEGLDVRDQYSYRTNRTIKWLADSMPDSAPDFMKSPKQLEHLAQGYLGSGLDYALAASQFMFDAQINDGVEQPTMRWDETPFAKSFKREPYGKYDKYLNSMYEVLNEANKIHNSINYNKKMPKSAARDDRISTLREENQALLYARGPMDKAAKQVSKFNKHIRRIYADRNKTPEQKRVEVDALLRKRSEAAQKVYDKRPGGKLSKVDGETPEQVDSYLNQLLDTMKDKPKDEQVDELISAQLPHTATLINDIRISDDKLRSAV